MANKLKKKIYTKFVGLQCACASHDLAPLNGVLLTSESTACHTTMASLDREEFPPVVPRQQAANNSFSIKNILNLSEDSGDEVTQAPNHEENRPMFGLPIVPQAIRPVPFTTEGNVPMYHCDTTQWFSAASRFPPWLPAGTHFMPYLPGEWIRALV